MLTHILSTKVLWEELKMETSIFFKLQIRYLLLAFFVDDFLNYVQFTFKNSLSQRIQVYNQYEMINLQITSKYVHLKVLMQTWWFFLLENGQFKYSWH